MRRLGVAAFTLSLAASALALAGATAARFQESDEAAPPIPGGPLVPLVAWYTQDPETLLLEIGPLGADEQRVAAPATPDAATVTGAAIVYADGSGGCITLATDPESTFNVVPIRRNDPGSAQSWTYLNDDPRHPPYTLVMQVRGTSGPYAGSEGLATFMSRGPQIGATGILVILLSPPPPDAQDTGLPPCTVSSGT
jgi:hypothetical protein